MATLGEFLTHQTGRKLPVCTTSIDAECLNVVIRGVALDRRKAAGFSSAAGTSPAIVARYVSPLRAQLALRSLRGVALSPCLDVSRRDGPK